MTTKQATQAQPTQAAQEAARAAENRKRIAATKNAPAPAPEPETFTREQVRELVKAALAQAKADAYKQPGDVRVIQPAMAQASKPTYKPAKGKLPDELDFVTSFIKAKRDTAHSLGVHSVFSGFNTQFKAVYGRDPIAAVNKLVGEGKLATAFRHGGVMIYLPADAKATMRKPAGDASAILKSLGF